MSRLLILWLMFVATGPVSAQPAADEVRAVVDRLFEGMRAGDSTAVRATLHPNVRFQSISMRDGEPILQTGHADAFVDAVGSERDVVWDEKVWNVRIDVDGPLAQAWMNYAFFLGDTFSHCGVNAMQFVHERASWTIVQILDTRQQDGCIFPDGM